MKKSGFINDSKFLVVVLFILMACDGVFIPDPIDPRIPKYTEEGNDVAGAFVNDNTWESVVRIGFSSTYNEPFITVWQKNDSLLLRFSGNTADKNSFIEFHLTGLNVSKFEDITALDGRKIQMDGIKDFGYYVENYTSTTYSNKGIGQIYFRHVRMDSSSSKIILSGTFGFSMNDSNGKTIKVTSGRFDYGITESINFQTE